MCPSNKFISFWATSVCEFLIVTTPCFCYHLLRVQFITPVHYSICWALSTWIIESYASIINYIVHTHNPHFRVYSFTVKIHCVGTLHTRSYIGNKLIYKYIFSFPKLNIYQILHFSVMVFMVFTATASPMKRMSYMITISFFFCNKYLWNDYSFDSGGLGQGQPILSGDEKESNLFSLGSHLLMALLKQNTRTTTTNNTPTQTHSSPVSVTFAPWLSLVHLGPWGLEDSLASPRGR